MMRMGLINCPLAPLEPNMWTNWNTPDAELAAKIGPGEVMRAVPWSTLTAEQKRLQRTKMAIHASMVSRMDAEIGKLNSPSMSRGTYHGLPEATQDWVIQWMNRNNQGPREGSQHFGAILRECLLIELDPESWRIVEIE